MPQSVADERVRIDRAGAHASASVRTPDGRWVRLHSGRDPVGEAGRFIDAALGTLPGGAPPVVVLAGAGLGYMVDAIEHRAPDTRVIVVEPFGELAAAMLARRDWRARIESRRLAVVAGPGYRNIAEAARLIDARAAAETTVIEHPVVAREFGDELARARGVIDRIVEGAKLNAEARRQFAGRYLLNTLTNLPSLFAEGDAGALRGAFAGTPALVVAAGPSLDAAVPHLAALADRALVIAVDTTLRPLRAAGIHPHVVVAVDPSELNARHLLAVDDTAGTWLVSEGSIDPRVFPRFAGRIFGFKVSDHEPWPWLRAQGFDRGTLRAWGSVLTTAFDLALEAGCDPIAFVGADLSFPGGVHYCRGTMNESPDNYDAPDDVRAEGFAESFRQRHYQTCETSDVHGNPIVSTAQFMQFRDWLVSRAGEVPGRRIVNATGAGILHGPGIVQSTPAELSWPPASEDIADRLARGWRQGRDERRAARRSVDDLLAAPGDRDLPLERWAEFTAGTLSTQAIAAHVDERWRTAPMVRTQPAPVWGLAGWQARVAIEPQGGPAPTVQWQASRDGGASWTDVAAATADTYVFTLAAADHGMRLRAKVTNRHGAAFSSSALVTVATGFVAADLDGDGRTDLFSCDARGVTQAWRQGESGLVAAASLPQPDRSWLPVAAGRVDGNTAAALLWRNLGDGSTAVWYLNGAAIVGHAFLAENEPDPSWRIVALVDTDDDGRDELVWHNASTGAVMVWHLDGVSRTAVEPLEGEPDLAWELAAAARAEEGAIFAWRHTIDGRNRMWVVRRDAVVQRAHIDAEPDPAWRIVGMDATAIYWRHAESGAVRLWRIEGHQCVAAQAIAPPEQR